MATAMTLTAKGQFTLNKPLLEHLGVKAGEKVLVKKLPDGSLKLESAKKQVDIFTLSGMIKTDIHATDEEIKSAIERGYAEAGMKGLES